MSDEQTVSVSAAEAMEANEVALRDLIVAHAAAERALEEGQRELHRAKQANFEADAAVESARAQLSRAAFTADLTTAMVKVTDSAELLMTLQERSAAAAELRQKVVDTLLEARQFANDRLLEANLAYDAIGRLRNEEWHLQNLVNDHRSQRRWLLEDLEDEECAASSCEGRDVNG